MHISVKEGQKLLREIGCFHAIHESVLDWLES